MSEFLNAAKVKDGVVRKLLSAGDNYVCGG